MLANKLYLEQKTIESQFKQQNSVFSKVLLLQH
jgi:hypothetical protein